MKKTLIINRYINFQLNLERIKLMKDKIEKIKPRINIRCPESYLFYKNYFHRNPISKNECILYLY